jgi:histidinol-phosphate aminotransferase
MATRAAPPRKPDPLAKIRPEARAIAPYALQHYSHEIKLNQNENPFDVPLALKAAVFDEVRRRSWSRYPPLVPQSLVDRLAAIAGWTPRGVLVGNGSNELIQATLLVTVRQGVRVIIPEPTFPLYALQSSLMGAQVERVRLQPDLSFDVEALLDAARAGAGVVAINSPNNPTGSLLEPEALAALCEATDALVVVDEAYHEFAGVSAVPLLRDHPNLVVLRTFSKALSLAALRVGYLLAAPDVAAEIHKAQLPYNVNTFSCVATEMLLDARSEFDERISLLRAERERLFRGMAQIPGVHPYPSHANFICFGLDPRPAMVFERLIQRGVLVRDVSGYPMLDRCLRVSVGTPDENARFLAALREAVVAEDAGGTAG